MNDLLKRQKDMYEGLWFGTIVLIILLLVMWFYPSIEIETNKKVYFTVLIIIAVPMAWFFFYRQKGIDSKKISQKENLGEDLYKGANILQGVGFKYSSIKYTFLGIALIIIGFYFLLSNDPYVSWWFGLILIIIGAFVSIAVRTFWKVGGQKLKGRYY